jgi:hypothetical protein
LAGGVEIASGEPKFDGVDFFGVSLGGVESRDTILGGCGPPVKSLAKADKKPYKDTYSIVLLYDFFQQKYERSQEKYAQP